MDELTELLNTISTTSTLTLNEEAGRAALSTLRDADGYNKMFAELKLMVFAHHMSAHENFSISDNVTPNELKELVRSYPEQFAHINETCDRVMFLMFSAIASVKDNEPDRPQSIKHHITCSSIVETLTITATAVYCGRLLGDKTLMALREEPSYKAPSIVEQANDDATHLSRIFKSIIKETVGSYLKEALSRNSRK